MRPRPTRAAEIEAAMDALDLGVACRPQVWVGGRALPAPYELVGQPVAEVAPPIAELLWTRRPYGADRTRPVPR